MHDESGCVSREAALRALQAGGVDIALHEHGDGMTLAKGEMIENQVLPAEGVCRKLVHYLSRKYNVPIHYFYNPNVLPPFAPKGDTSLLQ